MARSNRHITLTDAISQAAMEIGISQRWGLPVIGTLDQDILQMHALLSAVADEVLMEEPYKTTLGDGLWFADSSGTPLTNWTADNNVILFDQRLVIDGIKFRFKKAKGLECAEELRDFTSRLNKIATEVNGVVIDLYEDEGRVA